MPDTTNFNKKIRNGITYLASVQEKNGGYLSLSSPAKDTFEHSIQFHSVYSSTLILQNIAMLPKNDLLNEIKHALSVFIMSQKSTIWSWNYWVRNSNESKKLPYPDDLDDTFCSLTSLQLCNPSLITGQVLSCATQLLTANESKVGGPYKTWIVSKTNLAVWQDIDFVVNANIAYFLFLQGITLPSLTNYFIKQLKKNEYTSPYYPDPISGFYFLSRFNGNNTLTSLLQEKILLRPINIDPLNCALRVLSLLNLNYYSDEIDQLILTILESQQTDGRWNASAFYTGVNPNKDSVYYAGSSALSTSFCIHALSAYSQFVSENNGKKHVNNIIESRVYKRILKKIHTRFSLLDSDIQLVANQYLESMLKKDTDRQITLLPLFISLSLQKGTKKIPDDLLVTLGQASLYGWIAYTIYDDFLDNEPQVACLPLANICLRELTEIFSSVLDNNQEFHLIFRETMDKLENANCWEVLHTRFDIHKKFSDIVIPDFDDFHVLADRSMGHALSAIVIIMYTENQKYLKEIVCLKKFFYHLLIARQLNDDAHDWEQDLKKGQINSVGAQILTKADTNINLQTNDSHISLKKIFWQDVVNTVCTDIEKNLKLAEKYLLKSKVIQHKNILMRLLRAQKTFVMKTRNEKNKTEEFLSSYQMNYSVKKR